MRVVLPAIKSSGRKRKTMRYWLIVFAVISMGYVLIAAASGEVLVSFQKELAEIYKKQQNGSYRDSSAMATSSFTGLEGDIYKLAGKRDWSSATNCGGSMEKCQKWLADIFAVVAVEQNVPPKLLIARAWHESGLTAFGRDRLPFHSKPDPRNGRMDVGMLQVRFPASDGCDMSSVYGQLSCGAKYIRQKLDKYDGNVVASLTGYVCGHFPAKTPRINDWVVARSFILWQALELNYSARSIQQINSLGANHQDSFRMKEWGGYLKLYQPGLGV
jgi:hypothetical protein